MTSFPTLILKNRTKLPITWNEFTGEQVSPQHKCYFLGVDDLPGCYNRDPWCKLIRVVSNQPVCGGEEEAVAGRDGILLK